MGKPAPIIENINGKEFYFDMTIRRYWANKNHNIFKGPPILYVQKWNEEKDKYEFLYGSYLTSDVNAYIQKHFPHCGWVKTYNAFLDEYDGGICFE